MKTTIPFWTVAFHAVASGAFKDSSPFMFFSTSELLFSSPKITTASSISNEISSTISRCPSDVYVIAQQPGVSFSDYSETISTPHLKKWMSGKSEYIRSIGHATEVLGVVEPSNLAKKIADNCGAELVNIDASNGFLNTVVDASNKPQVVTIRLAAPTTASERSQVLRVNDLFLSNFIDTLPSSPKFTVFYATTPLTAEKLITYEMDSSMSPMHMDLKRDVSLHERQESNVTLVDGPLFERYQYLTPGIFMGLLAMFFLLSVGFVGVNALQSLQVSYAAFDKENGPAAQKKQQ